MTALVSVLALALALALPAASLGNHAFANPAPYVDLTAAAAGGQIVPLINSGDEYHGVTFEGIPDGIGYVPGSGTVDLYVAHEQSHVPFSGFADFQDSSVSRVTVDVTAKQVVGLDVALSPDLGFLRFCSAFMAGPDHGFSDYTFFVNEETNDIVPVPAGAPYGSDPAIAPYRQGGYAAALNTSTEEVTTLSRMGRHNHENTVIVPGGWKKTVSLSGDDTFSAPSSQLYLHTANDAAQVMSDKGQLWAFQVTATQDGAVDPADPFNDANDYLEITAGDEFSGRFIHVPTDIARGLTDEPPQQALENWSNENNVFQFVRVEDLAYDPDDPRTVYFTDTGTSRLAEDPATGRLTRLSSGGVSTNGRVFKMVLNAQDPRIVDALTILVDAADIGMRSPDNMDVGHNSIMVQEDTSNAKIWRYDLDLAAPTWTHVATANQPSAETSGIVDVSDIFGAGWWALDVQSHINESEGTETLTYTAPISGATQQYKERREDGQLLLMHIPGS
ncbi:MAG: alkaline phosphatase PhoX [Candidatus Limnocylindria bacterium]